MKELYTHYGTTYKFVKMCWFFNIKTVMKFDRTQHKRRQRKSDTLAGLLFGKKYLEKAQTSTMSSSEKKKIPPPKKKICTTNIWWQKISDCFIQL